MGWSLKDITDKGFAAGEDGQFRSAKTPYVREIVDTLKDVKPGKMIMVQPAGRIDLFVKLCETDRIPVPVTELQFDPRRKWRFDYSWPDKKLALEVEGGAWTQGRHTRGQGFINDMEKYNMAALMGWRILRVTPDQLMKTATIEMIKTALQQQ